MFQIYKRMLNGQSDFTVNPGPTILSTLIRQKF